MTDEDQIRNLLARFCQYLDARRFKEWSETFAEDGTFGSRRGRAAILTGIQGGELARKPELQRKHTIANAIIEINGDDAQSESDLVMHERLGNAPWTLRVGRYTDRLNKGSGQWLFVDRRLEWIDSSQATTGDAGAAPLSVADRLEIRELVARYCWAIDTRDGEALANTFTPDGVFDGGRRFQGRDELLAFGRGDHVAPNRPETSAQHWVTNMVLEGDGRRATARFYFVRQSISNGVPVTARIGHYLDELVKVDGNWLFQSRRYRDWPPAAGQ